MDINIRKDLHSHIYFEIDQIGDIGFKVKYGTYATFNREDKYVKTLKEGLEWFDAKVKETEEGFTKFFEKNHKDTMDAMKEMKDVFRLVQTDWFKGIGKID